MSSQPLVSAIIIFLDEERFIQEAIDSVLAQTYDNWELLLVDDGSTDGSRDIALAHAQQYPEKVRYLEHDGHQNRGMSESRNLGIHHAKGKYIAYLDGDDVWLPHKLERQVTALTSHPEAVMVYGSVQVWHSWTGLPADTQRDHLYGLQANGVHIKSNTLYKPPTLLSLFIRHKQLIPAGIMVEREVLERVSGAEEVFRGNYEDAVVLAKICLTSTVFVSSECWYRYRQHPDSCSKVTKRAGHSDASQLFFLDWVAEYLSQQENHDPDVWQALRQGRQNVLWACRHPRLARLLQSSQQFRWRVANIGKKLCRFPSPTCQ